jgi:hypothetical protein
MTQNQQVKLNPEFTFNSRVGRALTPVELYSARAARQAHSAQKRGSLGEEFQTAFGPS